MIYVCYSNVFHVGVIIVIMIHTVRKAISLAKMNKIIPHRYIVKPRTC